MNSRMKSAHLVGLTILVWAMAIGGLAQSGSWQAQVELLTRRCRGRLCNNHGSNERCESGVDCQAQGTP